MVKIVVKIHKWRRADEQYFIHVWQFNVLAQGWIVKVKDANSSFAYRSRTTKVDISRIIPR